MKKTATEVQIGESIEKYGDGEKIFNTLEVERIEQKGDFIIFYGKSLWSKTDVFKVRKDSIIELPFQLSQEEFLETIKIQEP